MPLLLLGGLKPKEIFDDIHSTDNSVTAQIHRTQRNSTQRELTRVRFQTLAAIAKDGYRSQQYNSADVTTNQSR